MRKAVFLCLAVFFFLTGCGDVPRSAPTPSTLALTSPASLPDWAQPGRLRSTRWDGGPIEAEKGRISRWPHFTAEDERGVMAAMRDWYNPRTVEFLKTAHLNCALVTFSNGFSRETEKPQWELLRRYITECHRTGIKVIGYYSIANMFWRDMFQVEPLSRGWVEILPDGSPRRYSVPNPHRYMADIRNPEWLDYMKTRIRAGIEAGIDGIWFDNTFSTHGFDNVRTFLDAIHQEATRSARKLVLMSNYNSSIYTWARLQNAAWTEDGREPGFYPEEPAGRRLVTNAGLLRYHYGISEGWRPVFVEYGGRHTGERFITPMEPGKLKLAAAESAAFQASFETLFEGMFARDCYFNEPKVIEKLKAWGHYNTFLEKYEDYYTEPESVARIAVLSETSDRLVPMVNQFAAENLQFDVLFNYQEPPLEKLKNYRAILLPYTNPVSSALCAALTDYTRQGGAIVLIVDSGFFGTPGSPCAEKLGLSMRSLPQSRAQNALGAGRIIYHPQPPETAELIAELRKLAGDDIIIVKAPPNVLYNLVRQGKRNRLVLHLLNYSGQLATQITVTVNAQAANVTMFSPEKAAPAVIQSRFDSGKSTFALPSLETYDLVAITLR